MAQRRSADPVGPLPHHATCGQNSIYYMASTCPYSDRGRSLGCFRCLDLNFISDPVSSNSGGVWVVHSFPNAVTHKRLWIPLQKDWENQHCAYVKWCCRILSSRGLVISQRVPGQTVGSGLGTGRGIESVYGCSFPQPSGNPPLISSAGTNWVVSFLVSCPFISPQGHFILLTISVTNADGSPLAVTLILSAIWDLPDFCQILHCFGVLSLHCCQGTKFCKSLSYH